MAFGGYNPGRSSELPFSNPVRSRAGSVSSIHSNQGDSHTSQQHRGSNPYQNHYGSRPGTPLSHDEGEGLYFGANNSAAASVSGYDSYESGPPSPILPPGSPYRSTPPFINSQQHQRNGGGNRSTSASNSYRRRTAGAGYDSGISSSVRTYYDTRSRVHSSASETSLNIDTSLLGGDADEEDNPYSPGLASLSSSASASQRECSSDAGSTGGFFSRKVGRTFRPGSYRSNEDYMSDGMDSGPDSCDERRKMNTRIALRKATTTGKKGGAGGKGGRIGVRDIFNDWDLLLPSADPYEDIDSDDDGLNEHEKWKRKQLSKKGWESSRGQMILIATLTAIATLVRIWKLAIPRAVVSDEQYFGGFTVDYLKGEFFMDVHPPLGKLLYTAVAYLLRFDGNFDFVPG
ncbi:hypothetical protein BX616_006415, partial [Lobosporangium transversale]